MKKNTTTLESIQNLLHKNCFTYQYVHILLSSLYNPLQVDVIAVDCHIDANSKILFKFLYILMFPLLALSSNELGH